MAGRLFGLYATRHDPFEAVVRLARPTMTRVGRDTGETVHLSVARNGHIVQVAQTDSRYLLGSRDWSQIEVPSHCSSLGKVLYAYGALPLPHGHLERRTAHSPVDRAQLDHALVEVRRRGWAASLDELELGLTAVGAPVRTVDGTVVAAVSVSGPTSRINDYGITQLGDLLVAELRGLSALLGHQPARKEGSA